MHFDMQSRFYHEKNITSLNFFFMNISQSQAAAYGKNSSLPTAASYPTLFIPKPQQPYIFRIQICISRPMRIVTNLNKHVLSKSQNSREKRL